MSKFFDNYANKDNSEILSEIKKNEIWKKEFDELKGKLESYFKFSIVDYIVSDILDCETYDHICLMINLAVTNNRISMKNSKIIYKEQNI